MSELPIHFVRTYKTLAKHRELWVEGSNFLLRAWETDAKGTAKGEKVYTRELESEEEARERLMKNVATFQKEKYELAPGSAPLPGPPEGPGTALVARLDQCKFARKRSLRAGAKSADLKLLRDEIGAPLPHGLAELLRWHDGMHDHELQGGFKCWSQSWFFLGAASIVTHRRILAKVERSNDLVPFCDNRSGDYLCVDMTGRLAKNKPGTVVVLWRDEDPLPVHASYLAFLETFVAGMEADIFKKSEKAWRALHAKMNPAFSVSTPKKPR